MGKYWGLILLICVFGFAETNTKSKKKNTPKIKKEYKQKITSEKQNDSEKAGVPPDTGYIRGQQPPPQGGGDKQGSGMGKKTDVVVPPYWIPICFMVPPGMSNTDINNGVKGVVDGFGKCDIAVEPFVFRVTAIDDDPEKQNDMAKKACNANEVFGVAGSAVQSLPDSLIWSDKMCKDYDPKKPPNVKGCSVLGNGAAGESSDKFKKAFDKLPTGNYSGKGEKGVPATSGVDQDAWNSPPVWCHELGHSVGGPGVGNGDYLVNEGEGQPPSAGIGLEKIDYSKTSSLPKIIFHSSEGGGAGKNCDFTPFGCNSLKGGSNPNDGKHKWDKKREIYYRDNPKNPPRWDLYKNQSFFNPKNKSTTQQSAPLIKSVVGQGSTVDENVSQKVIAEEETVKGPEKIPTDSEHRKSGTQTKIGVTIKDGDQESDAIPSPPGINGKSQGGQGSTVDENAPRGDSGASSKGGSGRDSLGSENSNTEFNDKSRGSQGSTTDENYDPSTRNPDTVINGDGSDSEMDENFFTNKKKRRKSGRSKENYQLNGSPRKRQTQDQVD